MNKLKQLAALSVFALITAATASATPVTGSIAIGGTDTFTDTSITFNPSTGIVTGSSGSMTDFLFDSASLTSFSFGSASGVTLFSTTDTGVTLSFTIDHLLTVDPGTSATGPTLTLAGTGFFNETGYDETSGMFSLTTSTTGITGFQLVSDVTTAATPEPSTFALLGTGLLGVAGSIRRRLSR